MARKKPKIEIKLLDDRAIVPSSAPGRPAGLDLYANETVRIAGRGRKAISTGVAMAIEEGFYGQIEERSGVSIDTPLGKKAGIIDSDYRGEIKVVMHNVSDFPHDINRGDKIAQIVFHRQEVPSVSVVKEFTEAETERGEKGFGSSD